MSVARKNTGKKNERFVSKKISESSKMSDTTSEISTTSSDSKPAMSVFENGSTEQREKNKKAYRGLARANKTKGPAKGDLK